MNHKIFLSYFFASELPFDFQNLSVSNSVTYQNQQYRSSQLVQLKRVHHVAKKSSPAEHGCTMLAFVLLLLFSLF